MKEKWSTKNITNFTGIKVDKTAVEKPVCLSKFVFDIPKEKIIE